MNLNNGILNSMVENVFNIYNELIDIEKVYNYDEGRNNPQFRKALKEDDNYHDYIQFKKDFLSKMELLTILFELERYKETVRNNWSNKQGNKSIYNINKKVFQKILK